MFGLYNHYGRGPRGHLPNLKRTKGRVKRGRGNPRENKGNQVLNKEEKKEEEQSGHSLRIKCTATTELTALMEK